MTPPRQNALGTVSPEALFNVSDVAVIGASPGKHYSSSVIENLLALGVPPEQLYPVNPRYDSIDGIRCFPDLAAAPKAPSLVVSLVGYERVPNVMEQVVAAGTKAVLVIADGFSEAGAEGVARQSVLAETARSAGIALLGPNSLGYAMPGRGIGAWVGGPVPTNIRAGNVAFISQSSGMLNLLMAQSSQRCIGISGFISVGNEAVIDSADFIDYFANDPTTTVLALVIESTTRPRLLANAMLRAREAGKHLVILSIGKSSRGMLNAASHAGRLATSAHLWDALFRQAGATVVTDIGDFIETVVLTSGLRDPSAASGVALATISGGDCGMLSDMAEACDLDLADVTPATQATLDEALERSHILANPLDLRNTSRSNPPVFARSVDALSRDPNVRTVGLRMNLSPEPNDALREMYTSLAARVREADAECVFMSRVSELSSLAWFELFADLKTPFLTSYGGALRAFASLQRRARAADIVNPSGVGFSAVPETPAALDSGAPAGWRQTQDWLAKHGVSYVQSELVDTVDEATACAERLGFPVALKGIVPGVAHKTEHGLVLTGLGDASATRAAATKLVARMEALRSAGGSADSQGEAGAIEVQRYLTGGTEFFVGAHWDAILGPVVSFGAGGIFLEVLRDVAHAIPPITKPQATALLRTTKASAMLAGARGQKPRDIDALAKLIANFSIAVATDAASIASVDLNPVLVFPEGEGVVAVDAYLETIA